MKPLPEMTERVPGVRLQSKFFVGRKRIWKPGSHEELLSNQESRKIGEEYRWRENLRLIREICGRFARLHELDRGAIGIAHVNHAFPGVRARLESLCLAHRAPTDAAISLSTASILSTVNAICADPTSQALRSARVRFAGAWYSSNSIR